MRFHITFARVALLISIFVGFGGTSLAQGTKTDTGQTKPAASLKQRVADAKELYKNGKLTEAVTAFEGMIKEDPESSDIQAWLGFLYLQTHRAKEAVPLLEKAALKRPNDLEVNSNLGSAYLEAGDPDSALKQYLAVEKLDPKFPQAAYNVGTIYLSKKDFPNAVTAFKRATVLAPNDAYGWNNLGVCYEGLQESAKAAIAYAKASTFKPTEPTFSRNAGLAYFRLHKYESAEPFLKLAHQVKPDDNDLTLALAETETNLGHSKDAATLYDSLQSSQAKNAAYWFNLGVLKGQANDKVAAEAAYRKCLDLNGSDLDALNNLGMMLFQQGRFSESEVLFDKLSGLNPISASAKQNLAVAAGRAGDKPKAIAAWKSLVRSAPGDLEPRVELANALWGAGDYEGAKYHYGQALLIDPRDAASLNGMGLYYLHVTKLKEAAASFRASMASDPKFVPAYNNLALALEKLNKRKQAIQVLTKAHQLAPNDPEVTKNLDRMKAAL